MLLQGSINKFELVNVLEFLARSTNTGVLEVHDFEEYGFIYLFEGKVGGISLPITDAKLGTRLLKAGCLTEQQLAEALMEDAALTHDLKRQRPLGQRLIERGFTGEDNIREVMRQQTFDLVFELTHWTNGVFKYSEPEQMPNFQVEIQGDVRELLTDAQRRMHEGERARKASNTVSNEVCFACPLCSGCTSEIKTRYLKNDICLWRKLSAVVREDDGRDGLSDARRLYRSADDATRSKLTAVLEDNGYSRLRDVGQPFRSRNEEAESLLDWR